MLSRRKKLINILTLILTACFIFSVSGCGVIIDVFDLSPTGNNKIPAEKSFEPEQTADIPDITDPESTEIAETTEDILTDADEPETEPELPEESEPEETTEKTTIPQPEKINITTEQPTDAPTEKPTEKPIETSPPAETQKPAENITQPATPAPPAVIDVALVDLKDRALSMFKNDKYSLAASVLPANASDKSLTWESSDPSVVSVKDGELNALAAGSAVITAKSNNGKTSQCTVTVTIPVKSVKIIISQREFNKGTEFEAIVEISPPDATDKSFTISSGNVNILKKSGDKWLAYGVGTARLTAVASNGVSGNASVTVVIPVESISLDSAQMTINRHDDLILKPAVFPEDATNKNLKYKSDNQNVAKVSGDGTVHAAGAGTATITLTADSGVQTTCEITVVVPVSDIYVEIDRPRYKTGETAGFKVVVYPDDATDKNYTVVVTGGGNILGENSVICPISGVTAITAIATSNGVSGKSEIEVIDLNAFSAEVLRLTNVERQKAGLPNLTTTGDLRNVAFTRAKELLTLFSHDRPDGRNCSTAYDENNIYYSWAGENIARGQSTPEEAVANWMNSPGHKANILNKNFGRLGVGVEMDSDGTLYWTQNFTN